MIDGRATEQTIEQAQRAYITCALWSSTDEDGQSLDADYTADDIAAESLEQMREDVAAFLETAWETDLDLGPIEPEQIGHDLWLTRNHHGAGFWDRGLGDLGDALAALAHPFGESYLYIGDDGQVYVA